MVTVRIVQRIREFVESQRKWTEHRSLSPEKWSADDIARYLLQRTLDGMEGLRASKVPLTASLPKPLSSRKLFSNQITVPALHGMTDSTNQIWKDLERHFVSDIVLCAKYLPLFIEEVVRNPSNRMELMMDRKKKGEPILDISEDEDGDVVIPLMVMDLFTSWIEQKVPSDGNSKGLLGSLANTVLRVANAFPL